MDKKQAELLQEVNFRDKQLNLLYNLLVKNERIVSPLLHLYGLSGTGKTYTIRKFMDKFCEPSTASVDDSVVEMNEETELFNIYLNCNAICYSSASLLFNEMLSEIKKSIMKLKKSRINNCKDDLDDDLEKEIEIKIQDCVAQSDDLDDDEDESQNLEDCSVFVRLLKYYLMKLINLVGENSRPKLFIILDNAQSLRQLNDSANILLSLSKLNEYLNMTEFIYISTIFISEIDWHSIISDCDLMSKTECSRPFIIYFNDYTKDQMFSILKKTAVHLIPIHQDSKSAKNELQNIEFYSKIILDVFYPICKDLNEIQYLIQIYCDQVLNSPEANAATLKINNSKMGSYEKLMAVWNKMKPFLKQALTQIYLRQSMFIPKTEKPQQELLADEFENLNLEKDIPGSFSILKSESNTNTNQLPKLMKYLLVSCYIATHNPAKYDKKLFDYNTVTKSRKSKFTAHKFQQNEETQRSAALKTHNFDLNRVMAIFLALISENYYNSDMTEAINLSLVFLNLRTLKSLHYIHQTNSAYSCLDEPKFKCLVDFDTIDNLCKSLNIPIKNYLVEYLSF